MVGVVGTVEVNYDFGARLEMGQGVIEGCASLL